MRESAKEKYHQAYHRLRTFQSFELEWEQDTYPTGYECPYYRECDTSHHSCACFRRENEAVTAYLETIKEAQRLLTSPIEPYYLIPAARSYAHRLQYLDHWGDERQRAMIPNVGLYDKLQRAKKRGAR